MLQHAILEAPPALEHIPEHLGVERAPEVRLPAGFAKGLAARRTCQITAEGYSAVRDPVTKETYSQARDQYSSLLADDVEDVLVNEQFPIVLEGVCSILLGAMPALRQRGRCGLLCVDSDYDFYQPDVRPLNGAASASHLAFATGRGLAATVRKALAE
jgi:arginase